MCVFFGGVGVFGVFCGGLGWFGVVSDVLGWFGVFWGDSMDRKSDGLESRGNDP